MLLSGRSFVDSKLGIRATASPLVRNPFKHAKICKGLGFHLSSTNDSCRWQQKRKCAVFHEPCHLRKSLWSIGSVFFFKQAVRAEPPDAQIVPKRLYWAGGEQECYRCVSTAQAKNMKLFEGTFLLVCFYFLFKREPHWVVLLIKVLF